MEKDKAHMEKKAHHKEEETAEEPRTEETTETAVEEVSQEDKLKEEIAQFKDKYLRAHAEIDNIKKRMERERHEIAKYGKESLIKDFLLVYDAIEKGIAMGKSLHPDEKNFIQGLEMMEKLFLEVLKRHGVEPIKTTGEAFDPHHHEAMLQVETDDMETGMVAQEMERGFKIHDRVLRPAKVSVSNRKEKGKEEE
jgi:molecular chaperone GrpE